VWNAAVPIRNDNLVLMVVVACGKDVGALDRLVKIPENIVDDDDSLCGIVRTSGIFGIQVSQMREGCQFERGTYTSSSHRPRHTTPLRCIPSRRPEARCSRRPSGRGLLALSTSWRPKMFCLAEELN